MRASRLLSILILLQLRVRLTAEALADEFEVSMRTIYRDIDALSAAGVPVYGDRGPGGGFALLEGYRTKLTGLDRQEAEAMLMIGMPGQAAALGLGAAAARAQAKMLAALTPDSGVLADRIAGRFHLDPVDWYRAAEPSTHLPAIARAVLDQKRMRIGYESWKGLRDRVVDPLGLVQKGSSWYLIGQVGGDKRTYRVGAIQTLVVLDDQFERPLHFDLPAHWQVQQDRFEQELRREVAHIRASPLGRTRIAELGAYAARAVAQAGVEGVNGWSDIQFPFENMEQGARALIGIGPEIEILAPAELRDAARGMASAIICKLAG